MKKGLRITECGSERADEIHALTQVAFEPYSILEPPSGALRETVDTVVADLAAGGGAVAEIDGRTVGCLRWLIEPSGDFHARRVAVEPGHQRRGVGTALMDWAEAQASDRGCDGVTVGVRTALPGNLAMYLGRGYVITTEHCHDGFDKTTWFALRKALAG